MSTNIYNNGGFYWFMGVVEDRRDPEALGRCRVRIVGYHNPDKTILPTEDLPWSIPLMPITSASISGTGHAPVGPVEGTWVMGFFLDGDECQLPVMLGTFPGRAEPINLTAILQRLAEALSKSMTTPVIGLSPLAIPVVNVVDTAVARQNEELNNSVTEIV
jgi:hypothetical protein